MGVICSGCGKTIDSAGFIFCPFCGERLTLPKQETETIRNEKTERLIQKALAEVSYPKRRKILLKGLEEYPDDRDLKWELLFTGEESKKKRNNVDFSVIKSHILDMYRTPAAYTEQQKAWMREQLFDAPELADCLRMFEDPEGKQQEYLQRLSREYIAIFLAGDNRIMGNFFGIRMERNRERKLAEPVAEMIRSIGADEKLSPEQRDMIRRELILAYAAETGGKTEYLNALL